MARLPGVATTVLWTFLLVQPTLAFLTPASVEGENQKLATQLETRDALAFTSNRWSQIGEMKLALTSEISEPIDNLEVVLFGVGDLRMDDHDGLNRAIQAAKDGKSKILPLVILDDSCLSNIPGVVSHTIDTANMLLAALQDLQASMLSQLGLELQVVSPDREASLRETARRTQNIYTEKRGSENSTKESAI